MHKRQLTIVGIVLIAIMILFATITFRQQAQDKTQTQQDEATIVKKGQVTKKEREYSNEYKKMHIVPKNRKFSEIIEESELNGQRTEDIVGYSGGFEGFALPNAPVITLAEFLGKLSCKADAIVLGYVKNNSSHMTEDETFIYTEYEFSIQDILKNNSASPIEVNINIQITRPGGLIKLNNRRIRIEDRSYEPLQKNKEYLLFLRFIPSANGYMASSDEGDFVLGNNSFKTLSKRFLPEELKGDDNSERLLNAVRSSISAGCSQNLTGGD